MLALYYKNKIHYRRPKDHPDIEEWKEVVKRNPLYKIKAIEKAEM